MIQAAIELRAVTKSYGIPTKANIEIHSGGLHVVAFDEPLPTWPDCSNALRL